MVSFLRLLLAVGLGLVPFAGSLALAQPSNPAAEAMLSSAQKAYNDKNYAFAAGRFREFLQKHGGHPKANLARFGLALTLIDGPDRNYAEARNHLNQLSGIKDFAERPAVLYHLGLANRGLGLHELAQGTARPNEMVVRQNNARPRFEEAARHFTAAVEAYKAKAPEVRADAKELPVELEWAARAWCDLAEMYIRVNKHKEAQKITAPFLKDPALTLSRYRDLGRYYHGFATFLLGDHAVAKKTLTLLAPFNDPIYGIHARYLLARAHHLAEERDEARKYYQAVVDDYKQQKKQAAELIKKPNLSKDPGERQRLEELLKNPPDHVARASFYLGVLVYEAGQFAEAKQRFSEYAKQYAKTPLEAETKLRLGFCQVMLKDYTAAQQTLEPMTRQQSPLADQAALWLGRARLRAAPDPQKNQAGYDNAVRWAVETFRQAAAHANLQVGQDAQAKERRGVCLLEVADAQQLIKLHREAATTCNQILNERLLPHREEELHVRLVDAFHLAGDYTESDNQCRRYFDKYPAGALMPAVQFRHAENGYFRILAAEKLGDPNFRAKEVKRLTEETVKRYQALIERFPDFPRLSFVRYGLGMLHYRQGELEKAKDALEKIPVADRTGELAAVPLVLADCVLRQTPEGVLPAGQADQLKQAVAFLQAHVAEAANPAETTDALLKLGLLQQRLAGVQAKSPERTKTLQSARQTYEKLLKSPAAAQKPDLQAQVTLELAKVKGLQGDVAGAINELGRFASDPLRQSPSAPLAIIQLANWLRQQNRHQEAVNVLAQARVFHEARVGGNPDRAKRVDELRLSQGMVLREIGHLQAARFVYELVVRESAGKPEAAEAALRCGQCLKEEAQKRLDAARRDVAGGGNPEQRLLQQKDALKAMNDALVYLETQAELVKQRTPDIEARARMYYEVAWGNRDIAELEWAVLLNKEGKSPQEMPRGKFPASPSEQKIRSAYESLIAAFPDAVLAVESRFELAELLSERGDHGAASKLLLEALDRGPPLDLTEKLRLRLGVTQVQAGKLDAALAQFVAIAENPKSQVFAQAKFRAGETLFLMGRPEEAIKHLVVFRDQVQLQKVQHVGNRGLFRLGQAQAKLKQWEQSRQSFEMVIQRFPQTTLIHEARYHAGWAAQQLRQFDQAINYYQRVVTDTSTEISAKAQLQVGLCRLEQKRFKEAADALLVVPTLYDYKELSAAAYLEAGRAFVGLNDVAQARQQYERVVRDFTDTPWATTARERFEKLK